MTYPEFYYLLFILLGANFLKGDGKNTCYGKIQEYLDVVKIHLQTLVLDYGADLFPWRQLSLNSSRISTSYFLGPSWKPPLEIFLLASISMIASQSSSN